MTTYYWKVTAVSIGGSTAGALWSFTTGTGSGGGAPEVVIYAADVAAAGIHGSWSRVADATAAAGMKLSTPDAGAPAQDPPLAGPANYFETTFQADGSTRYRVWLRLRAIANSKFNDSVTVQFSDSTTSGGSPIYRIGTTSGLIVNLATDAGAASVQNWGWQRNAYWLADTGDVWFQNSGAHTIRVQVREDGVELDQIVISPVHLRHQRAWPVQQRHHHRPQARRPVPGQPDPELCVGHPEHRLYLEDVIRDDLECVARRAEQRLPDLVSGDSGREPLGVVQRAGAELPEDWNNQHRDHAWTADRADVRRYEERGYGELTKASNRSRAGLQACRTAKRGFVVRRPEGLHYTKQKNALVSGAAVREGALGLGADLRGLLAVAE